MNGWLGVVSRAHVRRGVAGGFAQVNHGKAAPLRRMKAGDVLVYYSPAVEMGGAPLRAFTAIARIEDDEVFQFDMGGGFVPFRRRARYAPAREVPLAALKDRLELCAADPWSVALRRGLLPLSARDLGVVAEAMGVGIAPAGWAAGRSGPGAHESPHEITHEAAHPPVHEAMDPPGHRAGSQGALW